MPISIQNSLIPVSIAELSNVAIDFLHNKGKPELNGITRTPLKGVRIFRDPVGSKRQPLLYQSGIIIMLQGAKRLYLHNREIEYKKGDYMVLGVPLPAECAATLNGDASILGLIIDVPPPLLIELSQHLEYRNNTKAPTFSVSQQSIDFDIADATFRLLKTLNNEHRAKALGPGFIREIIYHVLNGPAGHVLIGLTENGHYARIAHALRIIHDNYASSISVESLATHVNMSVSGFHRAFRDVILDTPTQYIKKFRLSKAKEMISAGCRINDAAEAVGYKSPSQFSREFKRYYLFSPIKDRHTTSKQ